MNGDDENIYTFSSYISIENVNDWTANDVIKAVQNA